MCGSDGKSESGGRVGSTARTDMHEGREFGGSRKGGWAAADVGAAALGREVAKLG